MMAVISTTRSSEDLITRDALARLAATIELAYDQLESGDAVLAELTLRTELASPLLSGGQFYA